MGIIWQSDKPSRGRPRTRPAVVRKPRPRLHKQKRPSEPIDAATRTWPERLLDLRHATGFSQRQLARLLGMHYQGIRRVEALTDNEDYGASYYPELETIRKIRRIEEHYAKHLALYRAKPAFYDRLAFPVFRVIRESALDPHAARDDYAVIRVGTKRPRKRALKFPKELVPGYTPPRPGDLASVGGVGEQSAPVRPEHRRFEGVDRTEQGFWRWYKNRCNQLLRWAASGAFREIVESRSERVDDCEVATRLSDAE